MKTFIRVLMTAAIFNLGHGILRADAGYSFSFTVSQTHEGGTKKEYTYETIKNQKWSYKVIMENKSFKDVSDIEVKYVIFSKQDEQYEERVVGGTEDLKRHAGGTSIKMLKNNDSITFSTDAIMLQNIESTYYDDFGGAKGALKGLWLRIYVGGQMVAEYVNPTNLSDKQTFDPPPKE